MLVYQRVTPLDNLIFPGKINSHVLDLGSGPGVDIDLGLKDLALNIP